MNCAIDHEAIKLLPLTEWQARTVPVGRRGGPDYPGTETRDCACGSTLLRVVDEAAMNAYLDGEGA